MQGWGAAVAHPTTGPASLREGAFVARPGVRAKQPPRGGVAPPPWREPTRPSRPESRGSPRRPGRPRAEPVAVLGGRARLSGGEGRRVGRGGAGPGRGGAERPRLRLPRPRPPQPRAARAGGDACAPPRAACARARKVRGGAGLRARRAVEGERALGRLAVAGRARGRR